MRLPTTDELESLGHLLQQASIRSDGHTHEPCTAAGERWLRGFLASVGSCEDWPVALDDETDTGACGNCLGSSHGDHGYCIPAEVLYPVQEGGGRYRVDHPNPAPEWCPLRQGKWVLLRGES